MRLVQRIYNNHGVTELNTMKPFHSKDVMWIIRTWVSLQKVGTSFSHHKQSGNKLQMILTGSWLVHYVLKQLVYCSIEARP